MATLSPAVSSAIRDAGRPMILTRLPLTRALAPSARAPAASPSGFGVRTLAYDLGRIGAGDGTSSPIMVRARKRPAPPSFLAPGAERAHSAPFASMGTMKARAPKVSAALTIA